MPEKMEVPTTFSVIGRLLYRWRVWRGPNSRRCITHGKRMDFRTHSRRICDDRFYRDVAAAK